jgi:uncharacterized membrane protein
MNPSRLNALTDGVVAIVLTIMVLELKFPAEPTLRAVLAVMLPVIVCCGGGLILAMMVGFGAFGFPHH